MRDAMIATTGTVAKHEERELRGAPASCGVATGTARVIRTCADLASVRRGDVLVCGSPALLRLRSIRMAAGVVSESGGALSNVATIAREHGIPAVVAARDATTRIRNNQIVTIDGARGVISLLT